MSNNSITLKVEFIKSIYLTQTTNKNINLAVLFDKNNEDKVELTKNILLEVDTL